jgi:hypothetical protein
MEMVQGVAFGLALFLGGLVTPALGKRPQCVCGFKDRARGPDTRSS